MDGGGDGSLSSDLKQAQSLLAAIFGSLSFLKKPGVFSALQLVLSSITFFPEEAGTSRLLAHRYLKGVTRTHSDGIYHMYWGCRAHRGMSTLIVDDVNEEDSGKVSLFG